MAVALQLGHSVLDTAGFLCCATSIGFRNLSCLEAPFTHLLKLIEHNSTKGINFLTESLNPHPFLTHGNVLTNSPLTNYTPQLPHLAPLPSSMLFRVYSPKTHPTLRDESQMMSKKCQESRSRLSSRQLLAIVSRTQPWST